jgi:hypothetical protein
MRPSAMNMARTDGRRWIPAIYGSMVKAWTKVSGALRAPMARVWRAGAVILPATTAERYLNWPFSFEKMYLEGLRVPTICGGRGSSAQAGH